MRKMTIACFYISGMVLWITFGLLATNGVQSDVRLVVGENILSIIGAMLFLVSWGGALGNSARAGRWDWFFGLFFLSVLALIAYLFVGPVRPKTVQ